MSYPTLNDELSIGGTLVFTDNPWEGRKAHCHVCDWRGSAPMGGPSAPCPRCGVDYDALIAEIDAELDELSIRRAEEERGAKLGRNDPCWCGSGRKFKKCHGGIT